MQLLVLILGGLLLGQWLEKEFGTPPLLTMALPVVGLFLGLMIIYKNTMYSSGDASPPHEENEEHPDHKP